MPAIIQSIIKTNPIGKWYIELIDENAQESEKIICLDINEYAEKINIMGAEYGADVQVVWSQEENVTPTQVNEVRQQMIAYEQTQLNNENQPTG